MGDINLQREIWWNLSPHGDSRIASFRRLYTAKIERGRSSVTRTVALYEGHHAEEEWRCDIARYMAVRHPNIVQLYGTASCGSVHAAVFTDDLIPFKQFADLYQHSHFATVYIRAYVDNEFYAVRDYFRTIFGYQLRDNCTFFIRRSTGRFCADLVPGGTDPLYYTYESNQTSQQGLQFLAGKNSEATIINTLTMNQYHSICYWGVSVLRSMSISPSVSVNIGSVFNYASEDSFDDMVEVARLPNARLSPHVSWENGEEGAHGELMANGWTRFNLDHIIEDEFSVGLWLDRNNFWLSQAHHIFTSLQVVSNFHDYVLSHRIDFTLTLSTIKPNMSGGFLFLCPPEEFQTGRCSFKWPNCPAYWSLNCSGAERLTSEDAISLGFPSFQLSTELEGYSWNASVYAGLRQFHQAKGFDPDSQALARHLGYPLYQFSPVHTLFAHSEFALRFN
ncbi:hypothetical protein C8R45DRAFT_890260 [Mycena sanguinolenta]|nr:hypothetical protein C8R45DRAFT_890260 [Mycena sanguinolenta]